MRRFPRFKTFRMQDPGTHTDVTPAHTTWYVQNILLRGLRRSEGILQLHVSTYEQLSAPARLFSEDHSIAMLREHERRLTRLERGLGVEDDSDEYCSPLGTTIKIRPGELWTCTISLPPQAENVLPTYTVDVTLIGYFDRVIL